MDAKIKEEIARLNSDICAASEQLAMAGIEYEKKRHEAQIKLTQAAMQMTTLVSMMQRGVGA